MEVIRFSLLVTLTVALLSVAIRLASHSDSHPGAQPNPRGSTTSPSATTPLAPASTTPSPNAVASSSTPTTPTPGSTSTPPAGTTGSGSGSGGNGSAGTGSGGDGSGGPGAQPVLPVTGYDDAIKLVALSMVLIGGGALTVRASRR